MVYIKMQEEITVITKLVHKVRIIVCSEELQEETWKEWKQLDLRFEITLFQNSLLVFAVLDWSLGESFGNIKGKTCV